MSVFFNKEKNELILTCGCHCDETLHIKINVDAEGKDKTFYYISYMNSNFDRDQFGSWEIFKKKVKKIWAIIRNKDIYYSDIVMTQKDFNIFKEYINNIDQKAMITKIKNITNQFKNLCGNGKLNQFKNFGGNGKLNQYINKNKEI